MILTIIDNGRGKVDSLTGELLTMAKSLADEVDAPLEVALVGKDIQVPDNELAAFGVTKVHHIQHDRLDRYAPEAWARSVVQLMASEEPLAVLAIGSDRGNELLAHVAAITALPMAANCTEILPGDKFQVTRIQWGGSLLEEATVNGKPGLFTIAANTIEATRMASPSDCEVVVFTPDLEEKAFRVQLSQQVKKEGDKVSLAEARVVIGGGRGVGSAEGFASLEKLADLLGGAVGGSRVVTNLGWRPHADQIGQTGTRIAPDLYIACGISGAIQHMVGCKGAKHILAVNTDREAPILQKADYAVIGDLHEVVQALVAELES
jgi:electron transfer flavoprotein alpha subunit